MDSEKRKPISQEAAAKIVGGDDHGGGEHRHEPCTLSGCNCQCGHSPCTCTCVNHPHVG